MLAALRAACPTDGPRPVLLMDLDHFRRVNNGAGLAVGDEILRRIAKRIAIAAGEGAILGRIGDDEFAVLLPARADAVATGHAILEFVARPFAVHGHRICLTASIGSATWPAAGTTPEALLQAASLALDQAKTAGRQRQMNYTPALATAAQSHQALGNDLRAALAQNLAQLRNAVVGQQFALHFQPQVGAQDGRLTGFETLLRWHHPTRGLLGPNLFIPIVEEIGLMGLLGQWVLETACRAAAAWPLPPDGPPLTVSVNVSPSQLAQGPALVAGIAEALAASGLDPDRLHVEITETALLGDVGEVLRDIRATGAHLSLDDFGSGYSSLGNLARFPFDEMKMDRSFILALDAEGPGAQMIRAIAALGRGLGLAVVAEGVETEAQAALVRAAGVTTIQGYLFGRPVPESETPSLINRFRPPPFRRRMSR